MVRRMSLKPRLDLNIYLSFIKPTLNYGQHKTHEDKRFRRDETKRVVDDVV